MATAELDLSRVGPAPEAGRVIRALTSTPFLGVAVALLSWPIFSITPTTGPDPSWVAGLYMAHQEGLRFGADIAFTYGPLGFLQVPVLYHEAMWVVAFLYQTFIYMALAISLVWIARQALWLPLAVATCYCLLAIGRLEGAAVLLAFLWCFAALGEPAPVVTKWLVPVGGGLLAAVELLGKANNGITIFCLVSLTVFALPERRRSVPLCAMSLVGGLGLLWLATGQDPWAVPSFLSRSAELIAGYSKSMGTDIVATSWQLPAAVGAIALLVVATALATRGDSRVRCLASIALVALFSFASFKQGFVRQGLANSPEFFALMACAGLAVATRLSHIRQRAASLCLTALLVALALAAFPGSSLWNGLKPDVHVEFLRGDLAALFERDERGQLVSEARKSMRSEYRLGRGMLASIGRRPVHIDPWEIGVAWAYGLNWQPLPVIQSYSAFTPELDRLNAASLGLPAGPSLILRQPSERSGQGFESLSIDDRYPGWESPEAMRAMFCNYRPVRTTPRWQLLERTGNRCGRARSMGLVQARTGTRIDIPTAGPHELVFARVEGLEVDGWEAVRSSLYRARRRFVSFADGYSWRMVPETARDGLIVHIPDSLDYPGPFQLSSDSKTMSLLIEGERSHPVSVEFLRQRVGYSR